MSTRLVKTPTSRVRFGHSRVDITPPVGIYHRLWGAARHDRASGVHRPLVADVLVARVTDRLGHGRATVVNYACHPTTLAWDNSLISPDYVGAMRDVVEAATAGPCVFAQGASGDVGPRYGCVGDTTVADRNGRQLGYAALSALTALGGPATDFGYDGPVVSGATLGAGSDRPQSPEHVAATARFAGGKSTVELPLKPRPDRATPRAELDTREATKREAEAAGNSAAGRDAGAHAERARRWLARLANLPAGSSYPFPYSVYRLGDAIWVTCGGEPYNQLQRDLRQRFPDRVILFSPLDGALQVAYLLPRERYGQGLYQEEPSILAPGCLELLTEAITARIQELI